MASHYDVVTDWGADNSGSTDSTSAINNGISTAKSANPNGCTIYWPPGLYSVSTLDTTGWYGQKHIAYGGPSSVSIQGNYQGGTKYPIFDLTGSSAVIIDGLVGTGGTSGSNAPKAFISLAATTQNANSNANVIKNCGSTGYWNSAPLCVIGSPCNQFYSNRWQQENPELPVLIQSTNPDWGVNSAYQSITSNGATNCGSNEYYSNEFHCHHAISANDSHCWPLYFRNLDTATFYGGVVDSSANAIGGLNAKAHMLVQGSGNNILTFVGTKFYSESGYVSPNLMQVDTSLGMFATYGTREAGGYSGTRLTGVAPTSVVGNHN